MSPEFAAALDPVMLEILALVETEELGVQMEAVVAQALVLLDQIVLEDPVVLLAMQFQIPQV